MKIWNHDVLIIFTIKKFYFFESSFIYIYNQWLQKVNKSLSNGIYYI